MSADNKDAGTYQRCVKACGDCEKTNPFGPTVQTGFGEVASRLFRGESCDGCEHALIRTRLLQQAENRQAA